MQLVIKSIHIDHEFLQYGMKISGQKERAFLNHGINKRNLTCGEKKTRALCYFPQLAIIYEKVAILLLPLFG